MKEKKMMLTEMKNKIIVLTGSSGQLGQSYENLFLEHGATVIGLDLKDSKNNEVTKKYKDKRLFIKCDITNKEELQSALEKIVDRYGKPTNLINNAALDSPPDSSKEETGPFEYYPEDSWDKVMNVNVKGPFLCSQVFGSAMKSNGGGTIVNIGSIYGSVSPDQNLYEYRRKKGESFYKPVAYSASKSALVNLTKYLAVYWAKFNVQVNMLTIAGVFNNQDKEFLDAYCKRIPIGRMANPDDYHGALLLLCSDMSKYMTGSNLVVDGGWTAI